MKPLPLQSRVRELFRYRNGQLYRNGKLAGSSDGHGYRKVGIDSNEYQLHRIIWCYFYGPTDLFVDHKNRNKLDNRISNLRLATKAQNEWHTPKRGHNSTGFKGVYHVKACTVSPYWAYITVNGKRTGLGMHRTAEAAARAYNVAARKFHREFKCLNDF